MFWQVLLLLVVGMLWGATNPLIKKYSKDIGKIEADSTIIQFLLEIKYLATNVQYLIPMALNQFGSVLYFISLQYVDITLSVPVANSLTFMFTALSGCILGEKMPKRGTVLGSILILTGTSLCCMDKYMHEELIR